MSPLAQIRLLAWLRWRLTLRLLQRGGRAFGFAMNLLVLTGAAIALGVLFYQMLAEAQPPQQVRRVLLAAYWGLGLFASVMGYQQGSVYDPTLLFLYPIHPRTVFAGGIATRLFAVGSLIPLAISIGIAATAPHAALFPLHAAVFWLLHCSLVALSQLILLGFATLLAARRTRDLLTILGPIFAVGSYLGIRLAVERHPWQEIIAWSERLPGWCLLLLPPTWAADLLGREAWGRAAGWAELAALLAFTGCSLWIGGWLTKRAFFGEIEAAPGRRRAAREASEIADPFRSAALLGPFPLPARLTALRELRTIRRDPQLKGTLIRQLGFIVLPLFLPMLSRNAVADLQKPGFVIGVGYLALLAEAALLLNVLATEGRSLEQSFHFPTDSRHLFLGKNIAHGLLLVPLNLLLMLIADLLFGAKLGAATLALNALGMFVVLAGIGDVMSVLIPGPLPLGGKRALDMQREAGGGFGRSLIRIAALAAAALLLAPIPLIAHYGRDLLGGWRWLVPAGITLYVASCYSVCLWLAARELEPRRERVLDALLP